MKLASFVRQLHESGRVSVGPDPSFSSRDVAACDDLLQQADHVARLEAALSMPALDLAAARAAAVTMYRGCQALAFRAMDAEALATGLAPELGDTTNPSVHYSVDLTLRYLPDLLALATRVSAEDPLVQRLHRLAARWPLSSVGISGIGADDLDARGVETIASDPGLLALYCDRVIARKDMARLGPPRVRDSVCAAIGAFPELAPEIAAALSQAKEAASP